jgi:hypothetical protein
MAKVSRSIGLIATLALWAAPAFADSFTGNELHEDCRKSQAFVFGYVAGVTDKATLDKTFANDVEGTEAGKAKQVRDLITVIRPYCAPSSVTMNQAVDIVCKYLREKPETRHFGGSSIVQNAMREAFPCR